LCYGRTEFPLEDLSGFIGPLIGKLAGLRDPDIHSSRSVRCRLVAECLGPHVRIDPRLQELDFGAWEGRAWDDLPREALDRWAAEPLGFAPPGGESGAQLLARVRDFANDLRARNRDSIVVTHGGPLKVLLPLLSGLEPDLLAPAPAQGSVILLGP
jgi:alpha-ribazole phosphatase